MNASEQSGTENRHVCSFYRLSGGTFIYGKQCGKPLKTNKISCHEIFIFIVVIAVVSLRSSGNQLMSQHAKVSPHKMHYKVFRFFFVFVALSLYCCNVVCFVANFALFFSAVFPYRSPHLLLVRCISLKTQGGEKKTKNE